MIVKIKTRKRPTFRQLIEYMLHDKDRLFDEKGNSFVIAHNLRENDIDSWEEQFKQNEKNRTNKRKDSVILTHEILSWHKDDAKNITLEKLEDMAREYIRLRNPNGLYLIVPHWNTEHVHLHACVAGIEYRTGKGMRMSKGQFQELKTNIQKFQQNRFPELSKSVVNHEKQKGKGKSISDQEYQYKQRTGKGTIREELSGKINQCLSKAGSMDGFVQILKENNINPYERGGKFTGVWYRDKKFRFNRLPIDIDKVVELNKTAERQKQIQITRKDSRQKEKGRSR